MFAGVVTSLSGIGLILFTDIATSGVSGVMLIAGLIAGGLFLLVPAKLYLTLRLMKQSGANLKADREDREDSDGVD